MTTSINLKDFRYELCHALRNADIFTVGVRGVTTKTDTFTATAGQTNFTLTQTTVKNVRALTVQTVAKTYLKDYTINFTTGIVTLLTGATVSDAVVIQYDYGTGDKIYPDMPRVDLSLSSFPRVGISVVNVNTKPLGLGGTSFISDVLVSVIAWVPVNKDTAVASGYGGTDDLSTLLHNIREYLQTNPKSFYNFKWIEPRTTSPIISGTNDKIIQQSQDFAIRFLVEQ
jgi:hypothetical protein